jgi:hypothetical protein
MERRLRKNNQSRHSLIRYLKHNQINKPAWDNCILESSSGLIYGMSYFLDIVSPDWNALVNEDYSAVFPLTWRKKLGIKYLYQPPFTQQLGLFVKDESQISLISEFLNAIPKEYRLIEIQLNSTNKISDLKTFEVKQRRTYHLDLSPAPAIIRKKFSENLSRNIKKSEKENISVSDKGTTKSLIELFRTNRGKSIETLTETEYNIFSRLISALASKEKVKSIYAYNNRNELIAGAIFLLSQQSYIFIFSATNEEGKKAGAMSTILDTFIANYAGEKKVLDFEGSMDENLARYYKSYGSEEVVYLQIRKNNLPFMIRWLK